MGYACRGSNQIVQEWSDERQSKHNPKGICPVCRKPVATYANSMALPAAKEHDE